MIPIINYSFWIFWTALFFKPISTGNQSMKKFASPRSGLRCFTLASALIAPVSFSALAADDLTLYTTREPGLIQPLLDSWTKSSGIKVNTVYIKVVSRFRMTVNKEKHVSVYQKLYKFYIPVAYKSYAEEHSSELTIVDVNDVNNNLFGFEYKDSSSRDEGGGR
jgi:hypothetical protein